MVSMAINDKAIKLIDRGDVTLRFVQAHRVKATVSSFDGLDVYDVTLYRGRWRCSCQARRECCHIYAVALVTEKPPEPSPTFVAVWVARIAEAAGVANVAPHRLRHTTINDATGDLRAAQEFARHDERRGPRRREVSDHGFIMRTPEMSWRHSQPTRRYP